MKQYTVMVSRRVVQAATVVVYADSFDEALAKSRIQALRAGTWVDHVDTTQFDYDLLSAKRMVLRKRKD